MTRQGSSDTLPRKRVPPDQSKNISIEMRGAKDTITNLTQEIPTASQMIIDEGEMVNVESCENFTKTRNMIAGENQHISTKIYHENSTNLPDTMPDTDAKHNISAQGKVELGIQLASKSPVATPYPRYTNGILISPVPLPPYPPDIPMGRPSLEDPRDSTSSITRTIYSLLTSERKTLSDPILRFKDTPNAALFNLELLIDCNFNLTKLCNDRTRNVTNYCSEFKDISTLRPLLGNHHRWEKIEQQLTFGIHFKLDNITDNIRKKDLEETAKRGNHKSVEIKNEFVT